VAKRSPILGYNHNVRYRGLVFHVQTEDSGVLSPHLFTHLFYEGVIVSTRKLVYDAGASEDAIKALMQAQHKAVLKDLKLHVFDDKIDAYLGGTPGLEPREVGLAEKPRASDPEIKVPPAEAPVRAKRKSSMPPPKAPEPPIVANPEPVARDPAKPRTQTAERTSRGSQFRSIPPPEDEVSSDAQVAAAMSAQNAATVPTPAPRAMTPPPIPPRPTPTRAATPPPIPPTRTKHTVPTTTLDSSPEIEIIAEDSSKRNRSTRDTAVDSYDGVPAAVAPDATAPSDGVPGRIGDASQSMPPQSGRSVTPSRPPSHAASSLPPVKHSSRPSITPASVVSRPLPPDQRVRENTDAIEVFSPAPPSVDAPPGERTERPGEYSMKRGAAPMRDHTGRVAIPAGLGRPRPPQPTPPTATPRTASSSSPPSVVPEHMRGVPHPVRPEPSPGANRPPSGADQRPPHLTAPISARTGTGSSNVVMTRPAVIVGAPPKAPGTPTPARVRKAREDEGRGFGQGLISEKSLDEVILAYLSEDADDK
jgi:hypothetical protein